MNNDATNANTPADDQPRRNKLPETLALPKTVQSANQSISQRYDATLRVRCPHCHQRIDLVPDDITSDVTCDACGSTFNLATDDADTYTTPAVMRVGHFELVERLGMGAFGSVWKARDAELDRTVAVKIPRKDTIEAVDVTKFLREARAAAQLKHPNIVSVFEVGRDGDTLFIVSELIRGVNLADWMAAMRPALREAAALCCTIARALHHAHEAGVIHRDVKPGNILIDAEGQPHVTDFGLAKREAGEITMTAEGQVLGTPAYMAPEQALGDAHRADRRSDVYSLGVILFELLTGERPFRGNQRMLIHQVLTEDAPSPRRFNAAVPRDLETICLKAMSKEPSRRYASALDMAEDLGRYLGGRPILARPIGRIERVWRWGKRNPVVAGASASVAITLLIASVVSTYFAWQARLRADDATEQERTARKHAGASAESAARAISQKERADKFATQAQDAAGRADLAARHARREEAVAQRRLYAARMNLAQQEWESENGIRVQDLLTEYRPSATVEDMRGWEWYYQWKLCHADQQTLRGHSGEVHSVAVSNDGSWIASSSEDRTIKVWSFAGAAPELVIKAGHRIAALAISTDGKTLFSGSRGGQVEAWDKTTGKKLRVYIGHRTYVKSLAVSPDGKHFATASDDDTLRIWDIESGDNVRTIETSPGFANGVAYSRDGKRIATAHGSNHVYVWDAETGAQIFELLGHRSHAWSVSFSPDGKRLASASVDRTVRIWDMTSGTLERELTGHVGEVRSVVFHPRENQIAAASWGGTITIWDAENGRELRTLQGHRDRVNAVAYAPDGNALASGGRDTTVKLWDLRATSSDRQFAEHDGNVMAVAFDEVGSRLASVGADSKVIIRNLANDRENRILTGHEGTVRCLAFSPDGKHVVTGGQDRIVKIWDSHTGDRVRDYADHRGEVWGVAFHRNGKLITSIDTAGMIRTWDPATGDVRRELRMPRASYTALAFSPDEKSFATANVSGSVGLWDAETGRRLNVWIQHDGAARALAFSPDGNFLASAGADEIIRIQDLRTFTEIATLHGHSGIVYSLDFSHDGKRLLSASYDETVKIWDPAGGQLLRTLYGHNREVRCARFSPDGQSIASGGEDKTVRLWSAPRDDCEAAVVAQELWARPEPREVALEMIRKRSDLSESVRTKAISLFTGYVDDPEQLNHVSYRALRRARCEGETRDWASRCALAACRAEPNNGIYASTLALAHYRNGRHRECLETALRSQQLNEQVWNYTIPGDLAILAMAYQRLKSPDEAQKTVVAARHTLNHSRWRDNDDMREYVELAEWTVHGESRTWTPMEVVECRSTDGATITTLSDQSLLASDVNPANDTYEIVLRTRLPRVTALRLEALQHESLPRNGPGRFANGSFFLEHINAQITTGTKYSQILKWRSVYGVNRSQDERPAKWTEDADAGSWIVWSPRYPGGDLADQSLMFELLEPISVNTDARIHITLKHNPAYAGHNLGRFRLSATPD